MSESARVTRRVRRVTRALTLTEVCHNSLQPTACAREDIVTLEGNRMPVVIRVHVPPSQSAHENDDDDSCNLFGHLSLSLPCGAMIGEYTTEPDSRTSAPTLNTIQCLNRTGSSCDAESQSSTATRRIAQSFDMSEEKLLSLPRLPYPWLGRP